MKGKTIRRADSKLSSIVMSVCEVVVGILLLIKPVEFTFGVMTFLGIVFCLVGLAGIIGYFRQPPAQAAAEKGLGTGILAILLGIFFLTKKSWLLGAFPLLTVLYGVMMLVTGVGKVQWTVDMLRAKVKKWYWPAISAALTLIFAAIVLCNPFGSTTLLWTCTAIFLIIEAVVDLLVVLFAKEDTP